MADCTENTETVQTELWRIKIIGVEKLYEEKYFVRFQIISRGASS